MSNEITFTVNDNLKSAISELRKSGEKIQLEIQGEIINGELVIKQMDSYIDGPKTAPHCWHALTENTKEV
ncbi:hypothetical protein BCT04_03320 [Vibrio breoganii]|uniref:hypothetical protein n=1 Tax=Vibrio breoganii TaxID=553239 RepID=UPI000C8515A2|nr:hypothetical protein [Vibrio breoganii]PMG94304.1 hypothetical protein BCU80_00510 [Vibrio breoganii]PMK27389.1 hypothetical protein BCU03_02025 [Vibrio breoganii]PMK52173.1 hypothetical protein BCT98_15515 [Vibrio breoganii]PMK72832.1 hypothetical protein BCT94_12770 [Vibrio breoganii]PMO71743.1 hypothetical protein BCT04_03320 [Vibrio breoganii]